MRNLAVIPARGGSKGIKRKNIVKVKGHHLIEWTIKAARSSKHIDKVIVSTDDKEIAEIAAFAGAHVIKRPLSLAKDNVHSIHAVLHAIDWLEPEEKFDAVFMLLPTSPLRGLYDIARTYEIMEKADCDSVIGVTKSQPFGSLRYIEKDILVPLSATKRNFQRQEVSTLYAVNGAMFYAKIPALKEHRTFHMEGAVPYVMPLERSIDINTKQDLELFERLL